MHDVISYSASSHTDAPGVTMYFKRGNDQRRYNEPIHDEVAIIFSGRNDGAPPADRDIVVHTSSK